MDQSAFDSMSPVGWASRPLAPDAPQTPSGAMPTRSAFRVGKIALTLRTLVPARERFCPPYACTYLDLIRLQAGELHHLGPLFGFLDDELGELAGRPGKRLAAKLSHSRSHH